MNCEQMTAALGLSQKQYTHTTYHYFLRCIQECHYSLQPGVRWWWLVSHVHYLLRCLDECLINSMKGTMFTGSRTLIH